MKISKWDVADYLETPEDVAHFINTALEDGDPIVVKHAIGTAARSKGMATIAEEAGLNRTSLYRAFEDDAIRCFSTRSRCYQVWASRFKWFLQQQPRIE